jgi:hypothetical protein
MVEPPAVLYGESIGSAYQGQTDTLSKHFRQPTAAAAPAFPPGAPSTSEVRP